MPTKKPQLKTYTEQWIKDKFNYIASQERRTDSKQLEYIVLNYIKQYESEHGKIDISEVPETNQDTQSQTTVNNIAVIQKNKQTFN